MCSSLYILTNTVRHHKVERKACTMTVMGYRHLSASLGFHLNSQKVTRNTGRTQRSPETASYSGRWQTEGSFGGCNQHYWTQLSQMDYWKLIRSSKSLQFHCEVYHPLELKLQRCIPQVHHWLQDPNCWSYQGTKCMIQFCYQRGQSSTSHFSYLRLMFIQTQPDNEGNPTDSEDKDDEMVGKSNWVLNHILHFLYMYIFIYHYRVLDHLLRKSNKTSRLTNSQSSMLVMTDPATSSTALYSHLVSIYFSHIHTWINGLLL